MSTKHTAEKKDVPALKSKIQVFGTKQNFFNMATFQKIKSKDIENIHTETPISHFYDIPAAFHDYDVRYTYTPSRKKKKKSECHEI